MVVDKYRPEVGNENRIDNSKGKTMRGAIAGLMEDSSMIRIASGYFRLSGVVELEEDFRDFFSRSEKNKIELLISNQYDSSHRETRTLLGIAEGSIDYSTESFLLDNQFYNELIDWIKTGRLEVKLFVDEKFYETHNKSDIAFLHGKAYLFSTHQNDRRGDVLVGSSNFTRGGLVGNRELNIFSQDSFPAIKAWFDEMWDNYSVPYADDLVAQFEEQKELAQPKISYTPIDYFYWNLGKYFGKKSDPSLSQRLEQIEHNLPYPAHKDGHKFFAHQISGIKHVYEQLKGFDTQILADGVGLGKTLEAASIIKLYLQDLQLDDDKRKILILANNRLKQQWLEELANVRVNQAKIDFMTRQKFAELSANEIKLYAETYALVIIDEAHEGFLKKSNRSYQKMQEMVEVARWTLGLEMRGLLLTATPWNNSREDVIRLGLLFLNLQKVPEKRQYLQYLLSSREKILYDTKNDGKYNQQAYLEFWRDLFHQRTRASLAQEKYLSDRYPKRQFPLETKDKPFKMTYSPEVSKTLIEILERLIELKLPYQDTVWQYFGPNTESNVILRQRFQLLRRADSGNAAFSKSLKNIKSKLENFKRDIENLRGESLQKVKNYFYAKVNIEFAESLDEVDTGFNLFSAESSVELNKSQQERINYIDKNITDESLSTILNLLVTDTTNDIQDLEEILEQWQTVSDKDEKQSTIVKIVQKLVEKGEKVLLFSEFSDTVRSYYKRFLNEPSLASFGVGMVDGRESQINGDNRSKEEVLGRFSPQSKSFELVEEEGISVLIGTDAISTGQNLQDANHIMTIELPYNPMRLEQRIGRIDRPKLQGDNHIYVYAYPSEEIIGAELKLSQRFETKAKNAVSDTDGDFKLPFVHKLIKDGEFLGFQNIIEVTETEKIDDELLASVSEMEAKERVQNYYEKIGETFPRFDNYELSPYSISSASNLLLGQVDLKDINNDYIKTTSPIIWNFREDKELSFVEGENMIRQVLGKDVILPKKEARQLIDNQQNAYSQVKEEIVTRYNKTLKEVVELELQPAFYSNLRQYLENSKRDYKDRFNESKELARSFKDIIDMLTKRGFSKEQQSLLRQLKDSKGNLNLKAVEEKIWNNLQGFVALFSNNIDTSLADSTRGSNYKAETDYSSLNIISAIVSTEKKIP